MMSGAEKHWRGWGVCRGRIQVTARGKDGAAEKSLGWNQVPSDQNKQRSSITRKTSRCFLWESTWACQDWER